MAVPLNKFNTFAGDLGLGVHNLNADNLYVMLTDVAPAATNTTTAGITEIAAGNGYVAGGSQAATNAYSQTAGTGKLTAANVTFTASGGAIAQFRYIVLYNASKGSSGARPLIAWADNGSEVNLASGSSLSVAWDATNGVMTIA